MVIRNEKYLFKCQKSNFLNLDELQEIKFEKNVFQKINAKFISEDDFYRMKL